VSRRVATAAHAVGSRVVRVDRGRVLTFDAEPCEFVPVALRGRPIEGVVVAHETHEGQAWFRVRLDIADPTDPYDRPSRYLASELRATGA